MCVCVSEHKRRGGAERERETANPQQDPCCQRGAWCRAQFSELWESWPEQKSSGTINWRSHPGSPFYYYLFCFKLAFGLNIILWFYFISIFGWPVLSFSLFVVDLEFVIDILHLPVYLWNTLSHVKTWRIWPHLQVTILRILEGYGDFWVSDEGQLFVKQQQQPEHWPFFTGSASPSLHKGGLKKLDDPPPTPMQ